MILSFLIWYHRFWARAWAEKAEWASLQRDLHRLTAERLEQAEETA